MNKTTIINTLLLVTAALVAGLLYLTNVNYTSASVESGSEYGYSTTTAAVHKSIRTTFDASPVCTLGSVIIASSSATTFTLWNATSTTDIASSTIATFEANAAEGTYTFDVACSRGLSVIAPAGFNGYAIITHR